MILALLDQRVQRVILEHKDQKEIPEILELNDLQVHKGLRG